MNGQFTTTRNLFIEYTNYTSPLSFDEWSAVADDQKAAVLFVQFFDQITLAWYKANSLGRGLAEDGVSTVLQYLIKNVPVIKENPKRFTARYIYRIAYNCLYCICHDIKRDKERFEYETSNICIVGDDEVDLFDTVGSRDSDFELIAKRDEFWALIEDMDLDTKSVVSKLLGAEVPNMPRVSAKKREQIIANLQDILAPYKELFYA